jgi:HSP20 family protein
MSAVPIKKNQGGEPSILDEIARIGERIRQRAYDLFQSRGGNHGSDVDDWLSAEKELLCCPESQLTENENSYEIRVSLPGFQPDDIQVTALDDELIVKAEAQLQHQEDREGIQMAEFGQRTFLRRFNFSQAIDIDGITAQLKGEELHLTVPKTSTTQSVPVTEGSSERPLPTSAQENMEPAAAPAQRTASATGA